MNRGTKAVSYAKDDPSLFTLGLKSLSFLPDPIDEHKLNTRIRPSSEGLFLEVETIYNSLIDALWRQWCEFTVQDMRKTLVLQGYIQKKWFSNKEFSDPGAELSPQFILAILNLRNGIKKLYDGMNPGLAEEWLERLAVQLDHVRKLS